MPFLKYFFLAAALPLLAFMLLGVYLQPLSGDLTRLGNLSERSWGWNRDQAVIHVKPNDAAQDAAVLVIGDSFSELNLWQSVASDRLGARFLTFHWADVGKPSCVGVAIATLKRKYPNSKFVLVEAVERTLAQRFESDGAQPEGCARALSTSIHTQDRATRPSRNKTSDPMPDPIYAVKALAAEFRSHDRTISSGQAFLSPLTRTDLFSNKASAAILFLDEDLVKNQWRQDQVERWLASMKLLQEQGRALGIRVVLVIVPDKTTTYSPYFKEPILAGQRFDIWTALEDAKLDAVSLRRTFREAAADSVDFYLPDDSHLGAQGYILMGEAVARYIGEPGAR